MLNDDTIERSIQLINKTHQFNLTGYKISESVLRNENRFTLTAKLKDKFGDNGLVSVISAKMENDLAVIDIWVMSCRVLKRDLEFALFDSFIDECKSRGIKQVVGLFSKMTETTQILTYTKS